jgi:hypothetical protein
MFDKECTQCSSIENVTGHVSDVGKKGDDALMTPMGH